MTPPTDPVARDRPQDEPDPVECGICGDYTVRGVEVHSYCLAELHATAAPPPAAPGLREAVAAGIRAMREREQDLGWCSKPDQCHIKAEGARLALDDFEWELSTRSRLPSEEEIAAAPRAALAETPGEPHE